jgi:uncharacterized protein YdaU (DUF1376 family)
VSLQPERSEGAPLAFLKFYGSDFLNATASWTMEERGIYLTLLWYSWVNGGLPGELDRIDRMAPGAYSCWPVLESKFPVCPDGMRRNPRQERDRATMRDRSDSAAERGRKGAAQRWGSHSNSHPVAMQQPSGGDGYEMASQRSEFRDQSSEVRESESEKTHTLNGVAVEPVSVQTETVHTRTKRMPMPEGALERLWHLFPRKVGKRRAITLLERAIRDYATEWELDALDDAVEVMRERIVAMAGQYRKTEQAYIPHPATWLQQGRYEDPIPEETRR